MRPELPSGTVTFLFTDVEDSTKLLRELGAERYAEALAEHRRVIRGACAAQDGVEVDTQGDAFFFAFPTAPGALTAASAFTDALAAGPIQVRVGLHTGEPLLTAEGYIGDDVHFGARVASASHGGQVVVSAATARLVELPLTNLGEHRLKDISEPVSIYQLGDGSFPPLKTISNTNLPRPASSFVGRDEELQEVISRIEAGARLLTLTGPGGTGKTRLAIEAASTLVPEYKAGVFWVGLATLRDPALVTETISQTLGAKDELAGHIADREMLLLVDNLEQVIEAARELSSLLSACPNLTLLVTSRELLRIQGEVEYPVPPLAEPEAVELFTTRSQLDADETIAELCGRLDNLPLAVELAAARATVLSPAQILERLSQRLDLLKGGRDADPRQQTLRATIEWSYELLSPEEQRLFAHLSVFAGCTLAAAEEVCDADLDTLQSLVEKSLLRFTNERYWMLETVLEYAREVLVASNELARLCRRHADHVMEFAARARIGLKEGDRGSIGDFQNELDNIRAALGWLAQEDLPGSELDLLLSVRELWRFRGGWGEWLRWADDALARTQTERNGRRADVLVSAAGFANLSGDPTRAESYVVEGLAVARHLGSSTHITAALRLLAEVMIEVEEYAQAERLLEEATVHAKAAGDDGRVADAAAVLGDLALRRGDHDRAIAMTEQSLALYRELGDAEGVAWTQYNLAFGLFRTGREGARSAAAESTTISRDLGDVLSLVWNLTLLGALAAQRGHEEMCARLIGAADALRERSDVSLSGVEIELRRTTEDELRLRIGTARYEHAYAEGHAMSLEEAVEYALATTVDDRAT